MKKKKTRVLVKDKILRSLIELLKENSFDDISITDITAKAAVSRMAYYRNYTSKQDILDKYFENAEKEISSEVCSLSCNNKLKAFFLKLFDIFGVNSELGLCIVSGKIENKIMSVFDKYMFDVFGNCDDSPNHKYKLYFMSGAFYNVFVKWAEGGRREAPEEMADICCKMMSDTFGA